MAITTIRQLPNTDTLSDSDLILVSSGGISKNISWGQIKALIEGSKETVTELHATNASWMPTNGSQEYFFTNIYVTNLFSTTWITNDGKFNQAPSQAHRAIESIAAAIPKPMFTASQWWMISFGVLICIVCITRILVALKLNKP